MYNPLPYATFCYPAEYPWECTIHESISCIREGNVNIKVFIKLLTITILLGLVNVIVCMGLIIQFTTGSNNNPPTTTMRQETWDSMSRSLTRQDVHWGIFYHMDFSNFEAIYQVFCYPCVILNF